MYLHIGQEIEQFRILEELGSGGMGVVYKAEDTSISRLVALKVIRPQFMSDEASRLRFRREARSLAKVDSENIVRIYTYRELEDLTFIAMEYVDGGSLADLVANDRIDLHRALEIAKQILTGLDRAHAVGVIHRDIKPGNVMISDRGTAKLTDFGLARTAEKDIEITGSSMTVGTTPYMSPEQLQGLEVDFRSDLWSVGVVLYEILVRERPFTAVYDQALPYEILNTNPSFPDHVRSKLPVGLESFVLKSLEKDRDERHQSAAQMLQKLAAIDHGSVRGGDGTDGGGPGHKTWRRVGIAGAAVILSVVGFFMLPRGSRIGILESGTSSSVQTPEMNAAGRAEVDSLETAVRRERGQAPTLPPTGVAATRRDSISESGLQDIGGPSASTASILRIDVVPAGTIAFDGGPQQQPGEVSLAPGDHTIRCRSPRYGEIEQAVSLQPGEHRTIGCFFEAQININATPVWGTVWINSEQTKWTTPAQFELAPGKYAIEVRKFGYKLTTPPDSVVVTPSFGERQKHTLVFKLTEL